MLLRRGDGLVGSGVVESLGRLKEGGLEGIALFKRFLKRVEG